MWLEHLRLSSSLCCNAFLCTSELYQLCEEIAIDLESMQ